MGSTMPAFDRRWSHKVVRWVILASGRIVRSFVGSLFCCRAAIASYDFLQAAAQRRRGLALVSLFWGRTLRGKNKRSNHTHRRTENTQFRSRSGQLAITLRIFHHTARRRRRLEGAYTNTQHIEIYLQATTCHHLRSLPVIITRF